MDSDLVLPCSKISYRDITAVVDIPQDSNSFHNHGHRKKELENKDWRRATYLVVFFVLLWYTSSLVMMSLNKITMNLSNFNYPILLTFIHFSCVSLLTKSFYRYNPSIFTSPLIEKKPYLILFLIVSFCAAAEVSLINASYYFVSVSAMTLIRSSVVVFTYIGGVFIGLEKFNWVLLVIVSFIIGSISMTVPNMEISNYIGVVLLAFSVFLASTRWVLSHRLLRTYSSMQLLFYVNSFSAVFLFFPAFLIDVINMTDKVTLMDLQSVLYISLLVLLTIIAAFFITISEYKIVDATSSLSLCVIGVGKEILIILLSQIEFSEHLDQRCWIGIGLSIMGILSYGGYRYISARKSGNCHHIRT